MATKLIELRLNKIEYISGFAGNKFVLQSTLQPFNNVIDYNFEIIPSSELNCIDIIYAGILDLSGSNGGTDGTISLILYKQNEDGSLAQISAVNEFNINWETPEFNEFESNFIFESEDLENNSITTEIKFTLEINPIYNTNTIRAELLDKKHLVFNYLSTNYNNPKFDIFINNAFQILFPTINDLPNISEEEKANNILLENNESNVYKFERISTAIDKIQTGEISYNEDGKLDSSLNQINLFFDNYLPKDNGYVLKPHVNFLNPILNEDIIKVFQLSSMTNAKLQSEELFIEACGSDDSNAVSGITSGIHLRWALTGDLGKKHLPKGHYAKTVEDYITTAGYSDNPNDFVYIYRTPYINSVKTIIDFNNQFDDLEIDLYSNVSYAICNFLVNGRKYTLSFLDREYFMTIMGTYFSATGTNSANQTLYSISNFYDFIKIYTHHIIFSSYQLKDNFFYAKVYAELNLLNNISSPIEVLRVSSKSTNWQANYKKTVSSNNLNSGTHIITDEHFTDNAQFLKIEQKEGKLAKIEFEYYIDFIPNRNWTQVKDGFALSLNDTIVDKRLDNNYSIDKRWPKYNDGVVLNKQNYLDKWLNNNEGIKKAVSLYLENSIDANNLEAEVELKDITVTDSPAIKVRMLDLIKSLSLDYHVARMLGLGHIDNQISNTGTKYVYIAYYKAPSTPNLGSNFGTFSSITQSLMLEHIYMTLPTNFSDYRLPFKPELDNFSHEFLGEDKCSSEELFDINGYYKFGPERIININRNKLPYEKYYWQEILNDNLGPYDLSINSRIVYYGLEYKNQNQTNFISPELSSILFQGITSYKDYESTTSSIATKLEQIPITDKTNPIFTHVEVEAGNHDYALYGINWFSRASNNSSISSINTVFTNNNIKAPLNVTSHFIQPESPIVFTTTAEQTSKIGKVRVTFDWNHFQNINYRRADRIEFYFKKDLPEEIKGKVLSVFDRTNTSIKIRTNKFRVNTVSKPYDIEPLVDLVDEPTKFEGSYLVTKKGSFKIISVADDIDSSWKYPVFELEKIKETFIENTNNEQNIFESNCIFIEPGIGEYFSIVENLSSVTKWHKLNNSYFEPYDFKLPDNSIYKEIEIIDGKNVELQIGGIGLTADIEAVSNPATTGIPNADGIYKITFNGYTLPSLSSSSSTDISAEFYKGIVRLNDSVGIKRTLDVMRIEQGSDLVLYCYSPENSLTFVTSEFVNFHPSYRLYIDQGGTEFIESNFLPSSNSTKDVKQTLLALKARDTTITPAIASNFSNFANIIALKPIAPVNISKPETKAIKFATRSDIYGKSSFSFDIKITEKPFALQFYRANEDSILNALYNSDTIEIILSNLKTIKEGILNSTSLSQENKLHEIEYEELRMEELLNSMFTTTNEYNVFHGYKLPFPDKDLLYLSTDNISIKKQKIKDKILSIFIPVCKQPCVYSFIKDNENNNTLNIAPVLKNSSGKFLDINDQDEKILFNPFPFIIKLKKGVDDYIRFTDYTLEGNSNVRYYYFAKDIAKNLKTGNPSPIIGPVNLINNSTVESPTIEKVETIIGNYYLGKKGGFVFNILPYSINENVQKFELYRTFDPSESNSLRSMVKVGVFNSNDVILDEFLLGVEIPIEENIYYRIVPYKKIVNENFETEWLSGNITDSIIVKLPDFINPISPEITSYITSSNSTDTLNGVKLSFNKVMYKGKYHLYQLSSSGNWQLINTITNQTNLTSLEFILGNIVIKENNEWIYKQYKIIAENNSGLLSLDEKIFNLTGFYVPTPSIIGSKVACINQNVTYKTLKSKSSNTIQWKEGNTNKGNIENQIFNWASTGNKTITLIETDSTSNISVTMNFELTVKPLPSPSISGNANIWSDTEETYTTPNVVGNFYLWDIDGSEIISGQNSSSIIIKWANTGSKVISVQESNGGCITKSSDFNITIYPKPNPIITGNISSCTTKVEIYDLSYNSSNGIQINVQNGTFIQINPNQIEVTWQNEGMNKIELIESNIVGGIIGEILVDVKLLPNNNIIGNLNPNLGNPEQYFINSFNPENVYTWNIDPMFGTPIDMHDNTAQIMWHNVGTTVLELTENNGNCEVTFPFTINIT